MDLVHHWNLLASGIPVWFVDLKHSSRYSEIVPAWYKQMREDAGNRDEFNRRLALWSRREIFEEFDRHFPGLELSRNVLSNESWNGLNIRAQKLAFPRVTTLGILTDSSAKSKPKVSFALATKPFDGDAWFSSQLLVASISYIGGLYGNDNFVLQPPFIPELNEFYSRAVHFDYSKVRIEQRSIGVIIDAADTDLSLYALSVHDLFEKIFGLGGYASRPSSSGLLLRQLLNRMGGLQGGRVFKISGVRRLLRAYGLTSTFAKRDALNLIASTDPEQPAKRFSDYGDLYIEQRKSGTKLKPADVFSYLVDKGVFRLGSDLVCPACGIKSWVAIDTLSQRVECELCGENFDSVRQLVNGEWRYRRSGILGIERNSKGAIPVAITLQQLDTAFDRGFGQFSYAPSIELQSKSNPGDLCEVDFAVIHSQSDEDKISICLGECKDRGPVKIEEFRRDLATLQKIAESLPANRFDVYLLMAKLSPFTAEEVASAALINQGGVRRVILLTDAELEPYFLGGMPNSGFGQDAHIYRLSDLALATHKKYFETQQGGR
jgi:hypothetical protein